MTAFQRLGLFACFTLIAACSGAPETSDKPPTEEQVAEESAESGDTELNREVEDFKTTTRAALDDIRSEMQRLRQSVQDEAQRGETGESFDENMASLEADLQNLGADSREAFEKAKTNIGAEMERLRDEISRAAGGDEGEADDESTENTESSPEE